MAKLIELRLEQRDISKATRTLADNPLGAGPLSASDALLAQVDAEKALGNEKRAVAVEQMLRALAALEKLEQRASERIAQFNEEIAERAKKRPR